MQGDRGHSSVLRGLSYKGVKHQRDFLGSLADHGLTNCMLINTLMNYSLCRPPKYGQKKAATSARLLSSEYRLTRRPFPRCHRALREADDRLAQHTP